MKVGAVKVFSGLPGFETLREFLVANAGVVGTIVLSSRPASLVHARTILESEDSLLPLYELGEIEIQELGGLARALASHQGLPSVAVAGEEIQRAVIASVVRSLKLDYFAPAVGLPGFYSLLVRTARELRHARIRLSPEGRSGKLRELAELIVAFEERLHELGYTTLSNRIERILETVPQRPSGIKKILWIGESTMPALWLAFAEWLRKSGVDMFFFVEEHPDQKDFYPAAVAILKNWQDAQTCHIKRQVEPHHFMFSDQQVSFSSDFVDIMESADEYIESEWAVRKAVNLVESGVSPNKICFYVRESKNAPIFLQIAAKRFGVSLNFRELLTLSENSFTRQWLLTLAALSEGSIEKLAHLMLSSYSGLSYFDREKAYESVLGCLSSEDPWLMLKKLALDDESVVPGWVSRLCDWRMDAQSPGTLGDWIHRLDQLISETPWLDNSVSSDSPTYSRDVAAQDKLIRSLSCSRLSVDAVIKLDLQQFVNHAKSVWETATYGVTHHGDFRVVFSGEEIGDAEYLIVLGLIEGVFPRRRKDDAILSDFDRKELNAEYGNRLQLSIEIAEQDRQEFHRLLCSSRRVTLSYALSSGDHSGIRSSFIDDYLGYDPSTCFVRRTYSDRFPDVDKCVVPQDIVASSILHGIEPPHVNDSIVRLAKDIMSSYKNSECTELSNEEIVRMASFTPSTMKLKHFTDARECLFKYVANEKLRLSEGRRRWGWGQVAEIVRSTDVVSNLDYEQLRCRLMKACEDHLKKWQGFSPSEEHKVLRVVLPSILDSFVAFYGMLVNDLNLQPNRQGVSRLIETPNVPINFQDQIDIMFSLDNEEVPLRFTVGRYNNSDSKDRIEAVLFAHLVCSRSGRRSALFYSISKDHVSVYTDDPKFKNLPAGKQIDEPFRRIPWGDINGLFSTINEDIRLIYENLSKARFEPTPQEHCKQCGFGSLCRRHFAGSPYRKVVSE